MLLFAYYSWTWTWLTVGTGSTRQLVGGCGFVDMNGRTIRHVHTEVYWLTVTTVKYIVLWKWYCASTPMQEQEQICSFVDIERLPLPNTQFQCMHDAHSHAYRVFVSTTRAFIILFSFIFHSPRVFFTLLGFLLICKTYAHIPGFFSFCTLHYNRGNTCTKLEILFASLK